MKKKLNYKTTGASTNIMKDMLCTYRKVFTVFGLLILFNQQGSAQVNNKNIIYAEFATKGAFYSINYEHVFHSQQNLSWSYRVGGFIGNDGIALPVGINLFTGQYQHHAEFSLLLTPYIDHYHSFLAKVDLSDKYLYVATTIGYRYQKPEKPFYFKVSAGPLLFLDPPSDHFWNMQPKLYGAGYLALGISF